ncbi:MAG: hypothetical protein HY748_17510 [Elusimicrobia bacterium]|nr:hypothetical protein [Elusimicrobiota bacterium]
MRFRKRRGTISKWTMLPAGPAGREILQLMALASGGADFLPRIPCPLQRFLRRTDIPLHIELAVANHPGRPRDPPRPALSGSGIEIDKRGCIRSLRSAECRLLPPDIPVRKLALETGNSATHLLLGYGPELNAHDGTDRYDFSDPFHRVTRFHSLFAPQARITDPIAFLKRLHYKGIMVSRFPARDTLQRICGAFKRHLDIETDGWQERACRFDAEWSRLRPWQQRAALPVLDIARHMVDASPRSGHPLDEPGVILLDRPDLLCAGRLLPMWMTLVECLVPRMQCVLTLSGEARSSLPRSLQGKRLDLPAAPPPQRRAAAASRLPRTTVVLIDVDGALPNLALMKLSRYFKARGRRVVLARKDCRIEGPEHVYASSVFFRPSSLARVEELKERYGDSITVGGTGVDSRKRLPPAIENLPADYPLYPELEDRAIGFLTRGCPGACDFCIVPVKEGRPRQVADLDDLLQNRFRKLILLDDNILAHPRSGELLEDMARRDIEVNFNQTLDLRLLDKEKAGLLRRIRCSNVRFTRSVRHFSLNDTLHLDLVRRRYAQIGFGRDDNVEFICMYGYNTALAEDVERFRFLRSLPGAYVFVQRYQPHIEGAEPDLSGFFDERADALIDELIKILFPQNMKSMETYYRWLSKRYAQAFGKIHVKLVDTIFRYNCRHGKGRYIASLAGTSG